jgi:major membrane immunogen (membrane-anchored lipoprotein)
MKKRSMAIGFTIAVLTLAAGLSSVYAYNNFDDRKKIEEAVKNNDYNAWKEAMSVGINEDNFTKIKARYDNKEKIKKAIEDGDYDTWKQAISERPKIEDKITEENFSRFSEMYKLIEEGKIDEANKIKEELGLDGFGKGMRIMENGGRRHGNEF